MVFRILIFIFILLTTSCAHHKDVRPDGANGEHSVVIKSKTQTEGVRQAIAQATSYCKQFNKVPKVTSEGKKYQGDMDEKTYQQSKKLKDAASVFLGGIPQGGKMNEAADKYLGDPYSTEVKFVCE